MSCRFLGTRPVSLVVCGTTRVCVGGMINISLYQFLSVVGRNLFRIQDFNPDPKYGPTNRPTVTSSVNWKTSE